MISYMISCVLGRYQGYQEAWSTMITWHYDIIYDIIYDIMVLV